MRKITPPPLLLLNGCKLSYFIDWRCLKLHCRIMHGTWSHSQTILSYILTHCVLVPRKWIGRLESNEWGEPTATYRWTGLSLRNSWLKFKTSGYFGGIYRIYPILVKKTKRSQNATGWTCTHLAFDRLCPKNISRHCSNLNYFYK